MRRAGAAELDRVRLRDNRSTIWSLTSGGRALNLHRAFAAAPSPVLHDLATIAREAHRGSTAFRVAARAVREWPPLLEALHDTRRRKDAGGGRARPGRCCGSPAQLVYLRHLYQWLNEVRFDGLLPARMHLRLSNRMKTRLGQMAPGYREGRPVVLEIALNVDLLLEANDRLLLDTMVHEMAHVADWLFDGEVGHGRSWRDWAEYAGCEPSACTRADFQRRPRGTRTVTRVPALPAEAERFLRQRVAPEQGGRGQALALW